MQYTLRRTDVVAGFGQLASNGSEGGVIDLQLHVGANVDTRGRSEIGGSTITRAT